MKVVLFCTEPEFFFCVYFEWVKISHIVVLMRLMSRIIVFTLNLLLLWLKGPTILSRYCFYLEGAVIVTLPWTSPRAPLQPVPPCYGTGYFFSLEVSKVLKVLYFSRFHNQKVSKWHWLIFTPFGALGHHNYANYTPII